MTSVIVLVGNPKPHSRTRAVCAAIASRVAAAIPDATVTEIDLIDHAEILFTWPNATLAALATEVANCDILIVGSPTYKGSYTGVLKAFLDRYPKDGLRESVAVPVMTASEPNHQLGVEVHLRSLLVELGASAPSESVFFMMPNMPKMDDILDEWAARNVPLVLAAAAARSSTRGRS
ncbi:NAD(P)H-dependent oxidoreductase [Leifsonia kafniensis]|uniref:NAD(P)H-dependent oxidoreductase n=1 Tax=Leifsonia kafniensis TaxID=475957 RepID=A0ABP7L004_9MICO